MSRLIVIFTAAIVIMIQVQIIVCNKIGPPNIRLKCEIIAYLSQNNSDESINIFFVHVYKTCFAVGAK